MRFVKMHGIGNDFVLVDAIAQPLSGVNLQALSARINDRNFGVGGDGLILALPSTSAHVRMRMFNPDGSEAQMCGNGIRCLGKYAYDHGLAPARRLTVETPAGVKRLALTVTGENVRAVQVDMGPPGLLRRDIPMVGSPEDTAVDTALDVGNTVVRITAVSMGNPHAVTFADDLTSVQPAVLGPQIETHAAFPEGVNVQFVQVIDPRVIRVKTWERGAGETRACGTGACASLVAAAVKGLTARAVEAYLPGGRLLVEWTEAGTVLMTGPATEVFEGSILD